uniref:Uncharacterized protein n=1 Tax=Pyxicephalus adspersus TaxID=30357 RepID=A0AAV3A6V5_PYXAD|nr:TPA: hypothetical protein GDO54_015812 [Pyxicephalus adspersus]
MEESSRVPQRKMRRKATDPPKELLVIPLLVHFENKKVTQEEKTSTDESREAEPLNNDKGYISNELQSQDKELADLTLEKEIPTSGADGKIKTLQMDIEWNLDPNPDDELPMSDAPSVSLLPPINRKKGPGHQSSMANLKAPGGSNSNTLGSKSQSLPTGIIRGSIPEELKECCKGGSVGSLIMSPNGEIVCLSLMGAARDTDIPIRFDFIAEEEEEDCLPSESAGQEEQWSGSQQDSEKDTTKTSPNLEEVQTTNGKPPSGESTRKNPENIPNSKAAAPSTVEDEHSNKQDPTIKEANRNKEKQSAPDLQMEQRSPPGKQEMTEDEEMALLQEITNTTKKEVVKEKVKKKSKVEKAQKPEKNQVKAPRKSNQGSATEGKAAFVVGQPKDKKVESKIHYPKSTGKVQRQQTIQETQEKVHEMPTGEENDSEKESEDSYIVSEHLNRSPSPTETKDLTPMSAGECQITSDSVTGTAHKVSGQVSGQDSEQTAPKATSSNLVVTNSTNEDEYALSETSEATSSSFRQKSTRVRELSEKAERRRLEVERKRKEREEQLRLEKEQQERMERMREELEEEQRRREEEIQMRKQREEEERQRQEQERVRRMQLEQQALERARLQQEEYRRKLQEIQKRKQQEELERIALERQRQQEKERLEAEERMRLLEMAADEREEYQRRKQEREEQARQEAERRRLMAEAEAKALMEEAKRQAQLLARQTAALEQQLQFNRGLMKESIGMDQTQGVSRPWVFSYFEFLELLGIPLPVEGEST